MISVRIKFKFQVTSIIKVVLYRLKTVQVKCLVNLNLFVMLDNFKVLLIL